MMIDELNELDAKSKQKILVLVIRKVLFILRYWKHILNSERIYDDWLENVAKFLNSHFHHYLGLNTFKSF